MEPANKGKRYPSVPLKPSQIEELLRALPDSITGCRDRALLVLLWRTGLRISEALALVPLNIEQADGGYLVRVWHGKGGTHRVVAMDWRALSEVNGWMNRRRFWIGASSTCTNPWEVDPLRPIFCTQSGKAIRSNYVRRVCSRLADKAGIVGQRVHPHAFRHSHASELAAEGFSLTMIRDQLGHRNASTTDTYLARIAPHERVAAIARRDGWREG